MTRSLKLIMDFKLNANAENQTITQQDKQQLIALKERVVNHVEKITDR